jgi:hypothetical protein
MNKKNTQSLIRIFFFFAPLAFLLFLAGCQAPEIETPKIPENSSTGIIQEEKSAQDQDTSITKAGSYTFSGTIDPITVHVSKEEEVEIILDGVSITSSTNAPIYIQEAKDVQITLAKDSTNTIIDNRTNEEDSDDFPNAAIYSMSDLKIKGESKSSLIVEGNLNDGISSKDDLKIKEASITVSAKDDGIRGKDSLEISEGILEVTAGGDGLKSDNATDTEKGIITLEENEIAISAGDDGIDAVQKIEFLSGKTTIAKSYEGVEAMNIIIHDGILNITSSDDGINIAETKDDETSAQNFGRGGRGGEQVIDGMVEILGGMVIINAEGDGFDSNGNAKMTGGTLIVQGPVKDNNGPIDVNGEFEISGGNLFAIGSSGMAETPSESSTQNSLQINFETSQAAGTEIIIQDASEKELGKLVSEKTFQSITFSSQELIQGETYSLLLNGKKYLETTLSGSVTIEGAEFKRGPGGRGGMRDGNFDPSQMENRKMRTPPNMTLPDNWESMTEEERHAFMEENKPQGAPEDMGGGDRPEPPQGGMAR